MNIRVCQRPKVRSNVAVRRAGSWPTTQGAVWVRLEVVAAQNSKMTQDGWVSVPVSKPTCQSKVVFVSVKVV